jgi:hypothetical protein
MKPTKWTSFKQPSRKTPLRLCQADQVMLSTHKATEARPHSLAITIGEQITDVLRWKHGDKVELVRDGSCIGLMRSPAGYTLQAAKKDRDKAIFCRLTLKISLDADELSLFVPEGKPVIIDKPQIEMPGSILVLVQ